MHTNSRSTSLKGSRVMQFAQEKRCRNFSRLVKFTLFINCKFECYSVMRNMTESAYTNNKEMHA